MTPEDREAVKAALKSGTLRTMAVDPETGSVALWGVSAVLRHLTPHKRIVEVALCDGRAVRCTEDHSLFVREGEGVRAVEAGTLAVGARLATVPPEGVLGEARVESVTEVAREAFTYDLSVPGPQNFVLASGILAHNSYSIGGVSLDIERASKYESLKQNAESQFDKAAEAKARTVKLIRGLVQSRFGVGVRSSFGPALGRGTLSPRSFL